MQKFVSQLAAAAATFCIGLLGQAESPKSRRVRGQQLGVIRSLTAQLRSGPIMRVAIFPRTISVIFRRGHLVVLQVTGRWPKATPSTPAKRSRSRMARAIRRHS